MGIAEIFILIKGLLEFPGTILEFVKLLKKTPTEQHQDIVQAIANEAANLAKTGRPSWG